MRAGQFDRRIAIQRATLTLQPDGTPVEAWNLLGIVFAGVTPLQGTEGFSVPQDTAYETVEFAVRANSVTVGLTPKDRIVYPVQTGSVEIDSHEYDILAVNEIGRREGFKITAQRRPDV